MDLKQNMFGVLLILFSRVLNASGECNPYVKVLGMAENMEGICWSDYQAGSVIIEIQVIRNSSSDTYPIQWTLNNTTWSLHSLTSQQKFEISPGNLWQTFEGSTFNYSFEQHELKLYGVVLQSLIEGFGNVSFTGYIAVSCGPTMNDEPRSFYCDMARWQLGYSNDEFYLLQTCNIITYTIPVNISEGNLPNECTTHSDSFMGHQMSVQFEESMSHNAETTNTEQAKNDADQEMTINRDIEIICSENCYELPHPLRVLSLFVRYKNGDDERGMAGAQYNWTSALCEEAEAIDKCYMNTVSHAKYSSSKYFNYTLQDSQRIDTPHAVIVEVVFSDGSISSANYTWSYSPLPQTGHCNIIPASGYALTTEFDIICEGFSVSRGFVLGYIFKTNTVDVFKTGNLLHEGLLENVTSVRLEPGEVSTNNALYVLVEVRVIGCPTYVIVSNTVQVLPANLGAEGVSVVDFVGDLISIGNSSSNGSQVDSLLEAGNQQEAVRLLEVISLSINTDTDSSDETMTQQKTELRTAIVDNLQQVNISDFEMVSAVTSVLADVTYETEELTEETQAQAAELYDDVADTLSLVQADSTTEEFTDTVSDILTGVTQILDIRTNAGIDTLRQNTTEETEQRMEQVKNVSLKILNTVEKVTGTLLSRQEVGQNATVLQTDTMTVTVQRVERDSLQGKVYGGDTGIDSTTGQEKSSVNLVFPQVLPSSVGNGELGIQVLHLKKNPYVWDSSAVDVSSDVLVVDLKFANNTAVEVKNLTSPVSVSFKNTPAEEQSNTNLILHLVKQSNNITLNTSRSNILSFNFTAVPSKTVRLQLTPLVNISTLRVHVSEDHKPNLSEILKDGFIYPANSTTLQQFVPFTLSEQLPNKTESMFFIYNNASINSTGVNFVGVTVDLDDLDVMAGLQEMAPECLGNPAISSCTAELEIPIRIETSRLACLYWDKKRQIWTNDGCEVSPYSNRETLHCLCTHMTAFSGSVFVLPTVVDPIGDATLFLTFFDNPVVVTTVVMVWMIYFFLVLWAKRADAADKERLGVLTCPDNNPAHKYMYLICVATGWWKDAGTTANIYFFLKGEHEESSRRCLTSCARQCFQPGYEDWFLITNPQSLGQLKQITIWHDNSGTSPHWYVSQVYVRDLQTRQSWTFILNDWLAADRGSTLHTLTTISALTEDELKYEQKHNFMLKSSKDLRNSHLWISIFSKPVQSTFTRVQRLTCALSLLLCTMLTNIMFYGVPTNDPVDQIAGVQFSLSALIIGIESSLIMFPINLLMLQMFLQVKPHSGTKNLAKKGAASYRARKYIKCLISAAASSTKITSKMMFMISRNAVTVGSRISDKIKARERRQSARTDPTLTHVLDKKQPSSGKLLPWWCIYIVWVVVLLTCVVSSYFVMLYGLKYGYDKSISWLISFLTGFTHSAFIAQPLKVIAIALVFTIFLKKTVPVEDFGPGIQLEEDEQYLDIMAQKKEIHIPHSEPLSARLIQMIKERLKMEWLITVTIRDIALYIVYVTVVMLMVHGNRNVRQTYLNTLALEDVLVHSSCTNLDLCFFPGKADTVEKFYQYLHEVAVPNLADMSIADHDYATPGSNHYLVGPFRLRQLRVAKEDCSLSRDWVLKLFDITVSKCTNGYWIGNEDTGDYNGSWTTPTQDTLQQDMPPSRWTHQSTWDLKTLPYTGQHATYSGSGYILTLAGDLDAQHDDLESMWNSDWIDEHTRAVFLEFTLYNPNANLFTVVILLFEFTNSGGVFPSHQFFTTKLYHNTSGLGTSVLVSECLFLCFNLAFVFIEYRRYKKVGRHEYFSDFWNYVEILQICLAYSVVGLFIQRQISVSTILEIYRQTDSSKFVSFYTPLFWDMNLTYVTAFLVFIVTMKFIKLLRFNKRTYMVADTLSHAKNDILNFIFMVFLFFMAFGHFTLIAFGSSMQDYRNLYWSLMTVFNFSLGVSDLHGLQSANRILGPVYFALFVFLAQFCFLTIFIAIVNIGIMQANASFKKRKSQFELAEFITTKLKLLTGLK